jgi:hypothetical protein
VNTSFYYRGSISHDFSSDVQSRRDRQKKSAELQQGQPGTTLATYCLYGILKQQFSRQSTIKFNLSGWVRRKRIPEFPLA